MERIWAFFENLDEYVYASDVDTYEMVYMNRKAREAFGTDSPEELPGQKCYEVVQNSALPCTICNNAELEAGKFKEWRYFNPIIGRSLLIKDTLVECGGRRIRVELALDASKQEWQSARLTLRQDLAATVNEGMRVALRADTPDQSLGIALEFLGKALWGSRTFIFEKNSSGGNDNTYEWAAKGTSPERDELQNIPPERFAICYQQFGEGKNVVLYDPEQIRWKDPALYRDLKRRQVKTLVMVPLYDDQTAIGFFGVENPPTEIMEDAANMLQIMGHFIVSSIKRRNLMRELRDMSYHDQLTRVGNRHAMWEFVEHLRAEDDLGVVYCDVTGLKRVNDEQGHQAGDRLIIRSCGCLADVFGHEQVFRIGGDELLALLPGISERALREQTAALRGLAAEREVALAVGSVWQAGGGQSFQRLLIEAEHLMYEDKSEYYRRTGLDRRR